MKWPLMLLGPPRLSLHLQDESHHLILTAASSLLWRATLCWATMAQIESVPDICRRAGFRQV